MTFAWPLALVGLAAIPVLAALYLLSVRRRRRAAGRFANPALDPADPLYRVWGHVVDSGDEEDRPLKLTIIKPSKPPAKPEPEPPEP